MLKKYSKGRNSGACLSRRRFVRQASGSLLALFIPLGCTQLDAPSLSWLDLALQLTKLSEAEGRQVGQAHVSSRSSDRQQLISSLPQIADLSWHEEGLRHPLQDHQLAALQAVVRDQYAARQTREAAGWILSRLELDILALASLSAS